MQKEKHSFDSYCENQKKKDRQKIIVRTFILLAIWAPLVFYYVSPFSRASINIKGNNLNFNDEYIYNYASINKKTHLWNINTNKLEEKLNQHPYCSNAFVTLSFKGINIDINEVKVVAKSSDNDPLYYLSNGLVKSHSSIKDLLSDPLSDEFKFIAPYINKIPLIDKNEFKNDEFYDVTNVMANLDLEFMEKIKEVHKNNNHTFLMTTFVMDKNKLNTKEDIKINIDYRDVSSLLNTDVLNTIVNKLNNNENIYNNVLIENDIINNSIKIVPYN